MASYLGNLPSNNFVSLKRQVITGNGGSTYTLDHSVASVNDVAIFVNNVRQDPASYSISTTSLTLGGTISSSDSCYVLFLGQALQTVTPDANTITNAMLGETITVANGGTGVTTASALANTGNLVLLNTVTTTDATTTNIDFDSTYITSNYTNYVVYANVKPATDNVQLRIRFFVNGTLKSGASDYGVGFVSEGAVGTNDNDLDYMWGSQVSVGNASKEGVITQYNFYGLTSSTFPSGISFVGNAMNNNHLQMMIVGSGACNYLDANDGIRFYWSSGNFASGSSISLYGVKS